ncbi:MAG TPA: hypothetical protein VEX87_14170 [Skermanella sp.]|nr:hypothetical protein [Skermanella sp.]
MSKKTFEAARDSGNALLAQVKANQPTLLATLEGIAATQSPADSYKSVDPRSHGRQETREVETFDVQGKLDAEWDEPRRVFQGPVWHGSRDHPHTTEPMKSGVW